MPELLFPYTNRLNEAFAGRYINHPKSKKWFVTILSLLWVFLVLTVMHPIWRHQSLLINSKGYDIMIAVDISLSMNVVDSSQKEKSMTRLGITKEVSDVVIFLTASKSSKVLNSSITLSDGVIAAESVP